MNDRRFRERARLSPEGDADEAASLVLEALRRGVVELEQVALAAYLGHAPARLALAERAPGSPASLESWLRGLGRWGREVWVRAACVGAELMLPYWEKRHPDPRPRAACDALAAWLRERSPERIAEVQACGEACYEVLGEGLPPARGLALAPSEEQALAFRETRACALAARSAHAPGDLGLRFAVLALVAARERLALSEVPPGPGGQSLFRRAAEVDRLGHLPELNTQASERRLRAALVEQLMPTW